MTTTALAPPPTAALAAAVRWQVHTLEGVLGRKLHLVPEGGAPMLVFRPVLKLKEQVTIFADATEATPVLHVQARQAVALDIAHDVVDAVSGARVGTVKHRGLVSWLFDTWELLDADGRPRGRVRQTGWPFFRGLVHFFKGRTWTVGVDGATVGRVHRAWQGSNLPTVGVELPGVAGRIDPRVPLAAAVLIAARQASHRDASSQP